MKFTSIIKITFISLFTIFAAQASFAKNESFVSDSVITGKVKAKIALDKSISAFNIGVTTNHGVVYYNGVVDSDTQAESLLELAQATDGVKDINTNKLTVKDSRHPIKDTYITAKVKTLFIEKKVFSSANLPSSVSVETNNGVVFLSGNVKSQDQIENAIRFARSVNGVKRVESRLEYTR